MSAPQTEAAKLKALRRVEAEAAAAQHVGERLHEALDDLPAGYYGLRRAARRLSEAADRVSEVAGDAVDRAEGRPR